MAKACSKLVEKTGYDYTKLEEISSVPGIQPPGYVLRFPLYVMSKQEAHIVFSPKENLNETRDNNVYEFGNTYSLLLFHGSITD